MFCKSGPRVVNTIRYADDKEVAANIQKGQQQLMEFEQSYTEIWQMTSVT